MKKRYYQPNDFKYVGIETDYIVLHEGKILGFIHLNPKAKIQCTREGRWFTGPRWEVRTREGSQLEWLPVSRVDAARFLVGSKK